MKATTRLLTNKEIGLIVLAVFPIFLFVGGPIWRHPFDIDAAVYWSYLPIPVLVCAVLLHKREWTAVGFGVSAFLATLMKYAVTSCVAYVLWAFAPPPAPPPVTEQAAALAPRSIDHRSQQRPVEMAISSKSATRAHLVAEGQPIVFRSGDATLHTMRGRTSRGATAFNLPLVPGRTSKPITIAASSGVIELSCAIHPGESHGTLLAR